MSSLLTRLLGRLPIGWLQLMHNRTRLLAAVGGVTFSNILIFMQLGFMGALFETSVLSHHTWDADIIMASSDFQSLREINSFPRVRMVQALGVDGVAEGVPIHLASIPWTDPETGNTLNFRLMGVPPDAQVFLTEEVQKALSAVQEPDSALVDLLTRQLDPRVAQAIEEKGRIQIEIAGIQTELVGAFRQGASFDIDGTLVVSELTFLNHLRNRDAGTPTLAFLRCEEGADPEAVVKAINAVLPEGDTRVWTKENFIAHEQDFQASQTPIGFVFTFGVVMGVVVGLVIVYQVLTTDVQDHLREYATFKAIGYGPNYFLSVVFEEAMSLAALGFMPGFIISTLLYALASNATGLPIEMPWTRPLLVFFLTVVMCGGSGIIATRKLNSAQPAELF